MNNSFFVKQAWENLRKNKESYVPYIISCIGCIFIYFLFVTFINNPGMTSIPASETLKVLFQVGKMVSVIFVVIFIFYTNSFLMKRRTKEIGLYGILGMEKKHIAKLLFFETLFIAVISIGIGMISGAIFGKLLFMVLLKIIHLEGGSYQIGVSSILDTSIFFGIIFLVTLLWNFIIVKVSNPIELLRSEESGEKEPKGSIIITVIGILALAIGYYIASTAKALSAIPLFFVAVIAVIIGTYCLFTSGSITLLKMLKKNKKFYYQSKNFISVSNLIYRMKKNAVGLANICLLGTMILITVGCTVVIYISNGNALRASYPRDIRLDYGSGIVQTDVEEEVESLAKEHQVTLTDVQSIQMADLIMRIEDGNFLISENGIGIEDNYAMVLLTDLKSYEKITGETESLQENQVMVTGTYDSPTLNYMGKEYEVTKKIDEIPGIYKKSDAKQNELFHSYAFIFANEEIAKENARSSEDAGISPMYHNVYLADTKGTKEDQMAFAKALDQQVPSLFKDSRLGGYLNSIILREADWYSLYGGILFLGIFLGLLFTCACILIIYFKQISEGYEDKENFKVLAQVGMDQRDIKKTIKKQIQLVFVLPIAGALLHTLAAQPILQRLLTYIGVSYNKTTLIAWAVVALTFILLYGLVYQWTSKIYEKIIKR